MRKTNKKTLSTPVIDICGSGNLQHLMSSKHLDTSVIENTDKSIINESYDPLDFGSEKFFPTVIKDPDEYRSAPISISGLMGNFPNLVDVNSTDKSIIAEDSKSEILDSISVTRLTQEEIKAIEEKIKKETWSGFIGTSIEKIQNNGIYYIVTATQDYNIQALGSLQRRETTDKSIF